MKKDPLKLLWLSRLAFVALIWLAAFVVFVLHKLS